VTLYAMGEYSLAGLQATMHAKGLTSPHARSPARPFRSPSLPRCSPTTFYLGIVQWDGVRYPGQHMAIIPSAEHLRVTPVTRRERTFAGRSRHSPRQATSSR
jgi:hypothetical protein